MLLLNLCNKNTNNQRFYNKIYREEESFGLGVYKYTTESKIWRGKVKVKLSLCLTKHHAVKAYWWSGRITPRILWPRH
jgi:hypothetical protein